MSETEPIEITSVASPAAEKQPEREGLPSGYRMRADAHYVESLTSRRADRPHVDTPRADSGARPEPASRLEGSSRADARRADVIDRDAAAEPRQRRGDRVLAQLSEDIATIQSAAAMLAGESSLVARRVSVDLIRSHAWRASWLFRAHQILEGQHRAHVRPRPIGALLTQIRDGLAAECRLTGSIIAVQCSDWNATIDVDEEGLVAGISGAVVALLGLSNSGEGMAIKVTATVSDGELRVVEVTQDAVHVGAALGSRFLDAAWTDRPGGWTAGLGATVAKSVAHLAGGETAFLAGDKRGSTVRFTFKPAR